MEIARLDGTVDSARMPAGGILTRFCCGRRGERRVEADEEQATEERRLLLRLLEDETTEDSLRRLEGTWKAILVSEEA